MQDANKVMQLKWSALNTSYPDNKSNIAVNDITSVTN